MDITKRTLLVWLLAGLGGLALFVGFYSYTQTEASIRINVSRSDAVKRSQEFIQSLGFDVSGYRSTIIFDSCESIIFLQKNFGIKKTNELYETRIPCWAWRIDFFKELQKERFWVGVDPATGAVTYFYHALEDNASGAKLSQEQARQIAEGILADQKEDLAQYRIAQNETNRYKARTDHSFIWSRNDADLNGGIIQVAVQVYGNRLGFYSKYLRVPEEFGREFVKTETPGAILMFIFSVCAFLLALFAVITLVVQHKHSRVRWALALGLSLFLVPIEVLSFFNQQELIWSAYRDTVSFNLYYLFTFAMMVLGTVFGGLVIFLFFAAGESLSHSLGHESFPILGKLGRQKIVFGDACKRIFIGYGLGLWGLGYVTVFYLLAGKYFAVWKPLFPSYSNILATSMPFLFPLTVALFAALSEEFMSRLFTISLFRKVFKNTSAAIIISAMIWAMGHSEYAIFPMYVRIIELTIVGMIWGFVYLRYGLETVVVAHYAYNAVLAGIPLLRSGNAYFAASGIVVICLMALPILLIPLFNSQAFRKVFQYKLSPKKVAIVLGAVGIACVIFSGAVLIQSRPAKGGKEEGKGVPVPEKQASSIRDHYKYTEDVGSLAQKGYSLFKEKKFISHFRDGHYTDPDPYGQGFEFWCNGKTAIVDRDHDGYHETTFAVGEDGALVYVGSLDSEGQYGDVGKGFEDHLGRYREHSIPPRMVAPEKPVLDLTVFWAHNNRGNAHRKLGQYEQAIAEYREMIKIEPSHPISYNAIDGTYTLIAKERALTPEEEQDRKHNLELIIQNVKYDNSGGSQGRIVDPRQ